MEHKLTTRSIDRYMKHLQQEERSVATVEMYRREIKRFLESPEIGQKITKCAVIRWKERLAAQYSVNTVNRKLAAVNGLFAFLNWHDCRVRPLKQQRRSFRAKERELSKEEYLRLLNAAKSTGNLRLYFLMETLCSTGMRVSELRFVTVEALRRGTVAVNCKGKCRSVLLTQKLCRDLERYCRQQGISSGSVFITRSGKALDRSNIWRELHQLSISAGVPPRKVFPHNFRHLFAVAFYRIGKDIAKLADLLGHANIETIHG